MRQRGDNGRLNTPPISAERLDSITIERAVFTSIRSPMGSGYKLVAASAGVLEDEKREITQRAPSHGNLCHDAPDAEGCACFTLRSGRRCAFLSRHAGAEPSGRGGHRIHTHVLMMTPQAFRAAGADLFNLRALLSEQLDWQTPPASVRELDPFVVHGTPPAATAPVPLADGDFGPLLAALAGMLELRRVVVWAAPRAEQTLRLILHALPEGRRARVSCALGLRHSTQRDFDLVFVSGSRRDFELIAADDGVTALDWAAPPQSVESNFADWLAYARRCWETGRTDRLKKLADRLGGTCDAATLSAVARLETMAARTSVLSLAALEQMLRDLAQMPLESSLELELSEHLRERIANRKRELALVSR